MLNFIHEARTYDLTRLDLFEAFAKNKEMCIANSTINKCIKNIFKKNIME